MESELLETATKDMLNFKKVLDKKSQLIEETQLEFKWKNEQKYSKHIT